MKNSSELRVVAISIKKYGNYSVDLEFLMICSIYNLWLNEFGKIDFQRTFSLFFYIFLFFLKWFFKGLIVLNIYARRTFSTTYTSCYSKRVERQFDIWTWNLVEKIRMRQQYIAWKRNDSSLLTIGWGSNEINVCSVGVSLSFRFGTLSHWKSATNVYVGRSHSYFLFLSLLFFLGFIFQIVPLLRTVVERMNFSFVILKSITLCLIVSPDFGLFENGGFHLNKI